MRNHHQHYNEVRPDSFLTLLYPLKLFNSSSEFWPSYKSITREKKVMFELHCQCCQCQMAPLSYWHGKPLRLCGCAVVVLTWEAAVRLKFSFEMEMKIVPSMSAENPVGKSLFWLPSSNTVILTWFLAKMTWGLLPPVVTLLPHQRASKPLFSRSTSMYAPSHSTVCGALKLWNVASKYKPGSV